MNKRVLFACESSELGKAAMLKRGIDAHSCDLKPGELGLPNHHQCDVREILNDGWYMLIGFPDCTRLTNSGVRWLHERNLWKELEEAAEFFNLLLNCDIPLKGLENPIHHKYARAFIRKYDQIIQPYYFGDMESKATCLWLEGLPPLMAQYSGGEGIKQSVHLEPPGPNRKENRSRSFPGIMEAMAKQWGDYLLQGENK